MENSLNMMESGASSSLAPVSFQQSQWLQLTLSEVNKKMRTMMTLLGEDGENGNSPTNRAGVDSKSRLELIQLLKEFNRSYTSLAEKHDQLSSTSFHVTSSELTSFSSPESFKRKKKTLVGDSGDAAVEIFNSLSETNIIEDSLVTFCDSKIACQYLNKLAGEKDQAEFPHKDVIEMNGCDSSCTATSDSSDLEFQVTKLMEENLRQQAELARRNIEKTVIINELKLQVEHLKQENEALQSGISSLRAGGKQNSNHQPKATGLRLRKLFGSSCS